jgi:hypothetical protein
MAGLSKRRLFQYAELAIRAAGGGGELLWETVRVVYGSYRLGKAESGKPVLQPGIII